MTRFDIFKFKISEMKFYFHLYLKKINEKEYKKYIQGSFYICKECLKEDFEKNKCCKLNMKKLNQDLIDNGANNFWCFLLFYTRLFYKRKKYLSWFENARYKSEKYSKSNKDYVFELSEIMEDFSGDEKFFISKQMMNFAQDFVTHKLLNIPKSYDFDLQREDITTEEKKIIYDDIKKRKNAAKGFISLTLRTDKSTGEKKPGNTKTFVKLFNLSMNQFFLDLPLDDRVMSRVQRNFLNVMSPGIASGFNAGVENALENAKKNHKVNFEYVREGDQAYCIVDKLDQISKLEGPEIRNKFLEIGDLIPPREFKEGWRPYSTDRIVHLIKSFGYGINGRVYVKDVMKFLYDVLKPAANNSEKLTDQDNVFDSSNNEFETAYHQIIKIKLNSFLDDIQSKSEFTEILNYSGKLKKLLSIENNYEAFLSIDSQEDVDNFLLVIKNNLSKENTLITKELIKILKETLNLNTGDVSFGEPIRIMLLLFMDLIENMKKFGDLD